MKLLLDTHAFMWWDSEPEKIPISTLSLLQDPQHEVFVSLISLWEMQIKIQLGKLNLRTDLDVLVRTQQEQNDIHLMSVSFTHILALQSLQPHHKDPFDRLLIAQSQVENATLVSRDCIFKNYDCDVIW